MEASAPVPNRPVSIIFNHLRRRTRHLIDGAGLIKMPIFWQDTLIAGSCAAILSGVPSTMYAWLTGGDVMHATRAAGAMLISAHSDDLHLFGAATIVHVSISLLWAALLSRFLPRRRTTLWAVAALTVVAVLDLRVVGRLFAEIFALPFWPQFADHLAFGAVLGAVLQWRRRRER